MSSSPKETEDVAQTPPEDQLEDKEKSTGPPGMDEHEVDVKEQDRWLPIANVARIMKSALPDNAKIAKEAKECMQECVSEFISFITSEASEKCQQEKRKTVNGEDILFAMTSLGFENYSEALKIYLARYRESFMASQNKSGGAGAASATASAPTGVFGGDGAGLNLGDVDASEHNNAGLSYNGNGAVDY